MLTEDFHELTRKCRSIRRYSNDKPVTLDDLHQIIDTARLTPSGRNHQPLRYILVTNSGVREEIFQCLQWAGALKDWNGPDETERPTAYIVILRDMSTGCTVDIDLGISAQTIVLAAASRGIGSCMLASIKRKKIKKILSISDDYEIKLAISLGYPGEKVVIEDMPDPGQFNYWRDSEEIHHVPKRPLDSIIVGTF